MGAGPRDARLPLNKLLPACHKLGHMFGHQSTQSRAVTTTAAGGLQGEEVQEIRAEDGNSTRDDELSERNMLLHKEISRVTIILYTCCIHHE